MRRALGLVVALSGAATVSGVSTSSSFTFDGSSSDMVQQFYRLYKAGYGGVALSLEEIPSDVTARLDKHSLSFADLPPLLQRAVLWDTGYVAAYADDTTFSTIYTLCGTASTMADIALSLTAYEAPGCTARTCTDPSDSTVSTYRSLDCTGTQMASVSLCAATDVDTPLHSSMWATGGDSTMLPVPNVVRHNWTDSGVDYLIYGIHMVNPEHTYDSCPAQETDSSMIIPCVAYSNVTSSTNWCRPSTGALVESWLAAEAAGSTSSSTSTEKSPLSVTASRSPPSLNSVLQSFADSAPAYDGTSSNLALQYLSRHAKGDVVDSMKYTTSDLPSMIQDRLTPLGLTFEELDGLLQRALIWDSGYSPAAADGSLIKIYTKYGRSMDDIALPLDKYLTQCTVLECEDENGHYFNRSRKCSGAAITPLAYCASEEAQDNGAHLSMWADGGLPTDIPDPQVVRHYWNESNITYLMFAVHTGPSANEPAWDECKTSSGYYGSMIVPCRPYATLTDTSDWIVPKYGALVEAWLQQAQQDSSSWFKWWYALLLALVVLLIVALVLWWWYKKRRAAAADVLTHDQPNEVTSPKDGAMPLATDYVETQHSGGSNSYRALTTGSSNSNRERASANDAVRMLQEDRVLIHTRIPLESLHFTRILAKGGFGEVWMGYHQQTPVAIKKLIHSKQQFESVQGFIEEIKLTSSLDHPNIIHFVGVAWTKLENLCMVIEYLEMSDLQTFLERNNQSLTWSKEKYPIALGVVSAISYLHARRPAPLIHRDIKAKNILLTLQLQPKLIDFGVSRDRVQETMTAGIGTPYWAAPEVLEGNRYTEQSDIYSFGILLSELDTGETPFSNVRSANGDRLSAFQILNLVLAGKLEPELSPHCPPAVALVMQDCLRLDPMRRPTAFQLVERLKSIMFSSQSIEPPPPYEFHRDNTYTGSSHRSATL